MTNDARPFCVKASQGKSCWAGPWHIHPQQLLPLVGTAAHGHPKSQPEPPHPGLPDPPVTPTQAHTRTAAPACPQLRVGPPACSRARHGVLRDRAIGTECVATDAHAAEPLQSMHCDELPHRPTFTTCARLPSTRWRAGLDSLSPSYPPTGTSAEKAGARTRSFRSHRSQHGWPAMQASRGTGTPRG